MPPSLQRQTCPTRRQAATDRTGSWVPSFYGITCMLTVVRQIGQVAVLEVERFYMGLTSLPNELERSGVVWLVVQAQLGAHIARA